MVGERLAEGAELARALERLAEAQRLLRNRVVQALELDWIGLEGVCVEIRVSGESVTRLDLPYASRVEPSHTATES